MSATSAMIDGVKQASEAWGRAMFWILTADGEGYPSMATFQRAKEGDLDWSAVKTHRQYFTEVMRGDALVVSRAIRTPPVMPERLLRVMFMHHVVPRRANRKTIKAEQKARELGYKNVRDYWRDLDRAYYFLAGRVFVEQVPRETNCAHTKVVESAHETRHSPGSSS